MKGGHVTCEGRRLSASILNHSRGLPERLPLDSFNGFVIGNSDGL